jgi:hypothetical protein
MELLIIAFILIGSLLAFVFKNKMPITLIRIISLFSVLCLCLSIAGFVMLEYKMSLPFTVLYFAPLTMLLLILFLMTLPFMVVCWLRRNQGK